MDLGRTDRESHLFPEGHLKALIPGMEGTVSKSEAKSSILERSANMGNRLQQFIDDMYFIYEYNERIHIHPPILLRQMNQVDPRDDVGDWRVDTPPTEGDSPEVQFGMALSQIARPVVEGNSNRDRVDIAAGFALGMILRSPDHYNSEKEDAGEIVERIEEIMKEREYTVGGREFLIEHGFFPEESQAIIDIGFIPTPTLSYILGERSEKMMRKREWVMMENGLKMEGKRDPPEQYAYDVDTYRKIWQRILEHLIEKNKEFKKINLLRRGLDNDICEIQDEGWNNITYLNVFKPVCNKNIKSNLDSITEKVEQLDDRKNIQKSEVSKNLNNLAGIHPGFPDTHTQIEIINISGNNGKEYKLTRYGKLLYKLYFEVDEGYNELHKYAFEHTESQLESLISKVIESHYTRYSKRRSVADKPRLVNTTPNR